MRCVGACWVPDIFFLGVGWAKATFTPFQGARMAGSDMYPTLPYTTSMHCVDRKLRTHCVILPKLVPN